MRELLRNETLATVHTAQPFGAAFGHSVLAFTAGTDRPTKERICNVERRVRAASLQITQICAGEGLPIVRHQRHLTDTDAERIRLDYYPQTYFGQTQASKASRHI